MISPPFCCMMRRESDSPSPVPDCFVVLNSSNASFMYSSEIPSPESRIVQMRRGESSVSVSSSIAVVMEMVPAELATQITGKLTIPTVGIGAGPNCDAQVLVWQDMAGMTAGKTAKFVKRFGDVGGELRRAATQYADEVASGAFPAEEHSF